MIDMIGRLVSLWKPPQRVVDGKLLPLPEQIKIESKQVSRVEGGLSPENGFQIEVQFTDPMLDVGMFCEAFVSDADIAEKKAMLGHYIVTELTKNFREAVAAHPRADEARQFHHYPMPR